MPEHSLEKRHIISVLKQSIATEYAQSSPVEGKTLSLQECKDEIAKRHKWRNWTAIPMQMKLEWHDEAAHLFASQPVREWVSVEEYNGLKQAISDYLESQSVANAKRLDDFLNPPDSGKDAIADKPLTECMMGRDGECNHPKCPVSDEDEACGRYCTLPLYDYRK